jgi:cytochrome c heme-lyase
MGGSVSSTMPNVDSKVSPNGIEHSLKNREGVESSMTERASVVGGGSVSTANEEGVVESKKRECPFKRFWEKTPSAATAKERSDAAGICPVKNSKPEVASVEGCPVKHGDTNKPVTYNVYSQPINPNNQMPASAIVNQLPSPMQTVQLSTERIKSNIPKGGTDNETWTYPSPQMFYNALARKGKLASKTTALGKEEEEQHLMETVVSIHNTMNEATWLKILEWEDLVTTKELAATPKLLRFCGRPSELSPKARMKNWFFGHPLPFDRHDWTIVRSSGTEVRYVIDYYYDETGSSSSADKVKNILIDVRPALDGLSSLYHRSFLMPLARRGVALGGKISNFVPMPLVPPKELKQQIRESEEVWREIQERGVVLSSQQQLDDGTIIDSAGAAIKQPKISDKEAMELAKTFADSLKECQHAQKAVNLCTTDQECTQASLTLTLCMAKILCPIQHKAVVQSIHTAASTPKEEEEYDVRLETALENATLCIGQVHKRVALAKHDHPTIFQK